MDGPKVELLNTVNARKLAYKSIFKKQGCWLQKEIMQEKMPGARKRRRPRTAWMDNIKTCTGLIVGELISMTADRIHRIHRSQQQHEILLAWVDTGLRHMLSTISNTHLILAEINWQSTSMVWPTLGSKTAKKHNTICNYRNLHVLAKFRLERLRSCYKVKVFNRSAARHLVFVVGMRGTTHDVLLVDVITVLKLVRTGLLVLIISKFIFLQFGWKLPIRAPFGAVFGDLTPWIGSIINGSSKGWSNSNTPSQFNFLPQYHRQFCTACIISLMILSAYICP